MGEVNQSVPSYIIEFIHKWKNRVLPVINELLSKETPWIDVTNDFRNKKGCHLTYSSIQEGQSVYALIFKNCRSMGEKWELTKEGNIQKDIYKKPIVKVYSTSVALVPLDLIVPFISTDEILPVSKNFASPYGLGQKWTENLMLRLNCSPENDLIFFFISNKEEIPFKVKRFLREFQYILDGGYLRKKGFLTLDGPQWQNYYPSKELTNTAKLFLSASVEGSFTFKRLEKLKNY
jgi:hypothetical protein